MLLGFYQVNAVLVINETHILHSKTFLHIQFLFIFENSLIEKLLQLLVAIIDAELLKTVNGKILKSSNIQNANIVGRRLKWNTLVDSRVITK